MAATKIPPDPEQENRGQARLAFFSWFFALFGLGAGMLALLLVGTGEIRWSSPVGLTLIALAALGVVCLGIALGGVFRARGGKPGGTDQC